MISHFVLITIRIFSTCLFMRLPVLHFFLSITCLLCRETSAFLPFFRFFSLSEPFRDFTDAEHGCRQGFIRRVSRPITLLEKGRICGEYTSNRRIKHDSRPLHLGNRTAPAERRQEQAGKYDGKKGVRLCRYKCRGNEVEKGPAWAGQARVCRGKHERDSPYPRSTPEFRPGGMKARSE